MEASLQSLDELITTNPQDLSSLQLLITIATLESFLDDIAHNPNVIICSYCCCMVYCYYYKDIEMSN